MPRRQLPGGGAGMSYLATRYSAVHAQEREWLLHIHDAERRDIAQVDQGVFVTGRPPENLSLLASVSFSPRSETCDDSDRGTGPIDARWAVRRCPVRG